MNLNATEETSDLKRFMRVLQVVWNFASGGCYLSVPAVPSEYRQTIRQAVVGSGLPKVRDWLAVSRPETWYTGFRTFEVAVDPDDGAVCLVERQNQEVIAIEQVAPNESPLY